MAWRLCARRVGRDLAGVIGRVHLRIGGGDSARPVDQIADPIRITCAGSLRSPIFDGDLMVDVGKQLKWKIELARELGIGCWIVEAYA